jgi:hypothetical protein
MVYGSWPPQSSFESRLQVLAQPEKRIEQSQHRTNPPPAQVSHVVREWSCQSPGEFSSWLHRREPRVSALRARRRESGRGTHTKCVIYTYIRTTFGQIDQGRRSPKVSDHSDHVVRKNSVTSQRWIMITFDSLNESINFSNKRTRTE